ncbi:MAG TPA: DUF488 family protein [Holophagaceae bacterium]|jgi:uncharacterized protein YeaO (DUF488 family)|nr:DUF488 family protein [Holophagaceae bacterium]
MIRIKRAYEPALKADGARVLVDRLWPRGCTKEALELHSWAKSVTPSSDLRKAFHSGALTFAAFSERYGRELALPEARESLDELAALTRKGTLTLITANKDEVQNHALVLKAALESHLHKGKP